MSAQTGEEKLDCSVARNHNVPPGGGGGTTGGGGVMLCTPQLIVIEKNRQLGRGGEKFDRYIYENSAIYIIYLFHTVRPKRPIGGGGGVSGDPGS